MWVTAAVGLAAGAGLAILATATTLAYFIVAFAFPPLASRLPRPRSALSTLQVTYADGRGVLREAIAKCTAGGFAVADISTRRLVSGEGEDAGTVSVRLELHGIGDLDVLAAELSALDGVLAVNADRPDDT